MFIGCAGWSLGREHWPQFPAEGTHLQRYAARFDCVEINSSFYRPHRRQTYARWADSVPPDFRFSVKVPKLITHELRLRDSDQALDEFLGQCEGLAERLGCLLVQLPPSLAFEPASAEPFFVALRQRFDGDVVLEPRHESWVAAAPMLQAYRITQVVVDPSRISTDGSVQGWPGVRYWRLHGSPRIYHSAYELPCLQRLAQDMKACAAEGASVWCIFDNTASGAALGNAMTLAALVQT
ncbi:DUF72 domain-containing protein [Pseudomonas sp. HMWF021]|jgi:uncharacterized protein YecE (DUF72 family)|uniref:DUF72 domain-containing protein n=1 Tax=Pseudomonas sp. HMWF021 TaxID=2056857 RepID=UPI000D360754|nr:DUF72 domain-containing protein [Pseudomonas sp. HMWF021]PTT28676.1 DUF72 domain-containing protein [Pseudomonas sp. HMWF021]